MAECAEELRDGCDGYIGLYSIQNGNEQLIDCLQSEVDADIQLNHRVLKVGKTATGPLSTHMMNGKGPETRDFDLVVMCCRTPGSRHAMDGEQLRKSMVSMWPISMPRALFAGLDPVRHSVLGEKIPGAMFMSEASAAAVFYNEGARHDVASTASELADRRSMRWLSPISAIRS